ncbi:hemin-degrading factor [Derxia lacustris]|uniref:hemin-degrading factor n=1 Tax=Derxia lacustris TaxID=764842 RepID=UPI000A177E54|nr:ChuX/HutX family heme-like substrate-binding protein [Derxia lacustris]
MADLHHDLRLAFAEGRAAGARHRDIAARLGVPEGELIAAHAGLFGAEESPLKATRLRPPWDTLLGALEPLGELLALTRNPACVHEKTGVYRGLGGAGPVGLVLGGAIDLRLFWREWAHGFAVDETLADGRHQRSLQFFDAGGEAVHKVFTTPATDLEEYCALVARFMDPRLFHGIDCIGRPAPDAPLADEDIDVTGLRDAWLAMTDTHEFFGLLRRFKVTRVQGLRLAGRALAHRIDGGAARALLTGAAASGVPVMVFVGNPGCIQIHTGPVRRVEALGPWLNVLDDGFNLHLREDHIDSAWVVRKPTADGIVTSLEVFDAGGLNLAMFFGERKPGQPERADWRALVAGLEAEPQPCAR